MERRDALRLMALGGLGLGLGCSAPKVEAASPVPQITNPAQEKTATQIATPSRNESPKSNPTTENVNLNPDSAGRPFAQAALEKNIDRMFELLAPDTKNSYRSIFTKEGLEQFWGIYACPTGKVTNDQAVVRFDPNSVDGGWYSTYEVSGCQFREMTVVLEKVIQGGKDKYFPKYLRR